MSRQDTDIVVVGAGPCGIAVGAAARRAGLRAVLFDAGPLCASIVQYPPYMAFFSTAEKLEIENLPFTTSGPNPTRKEALAYYRGVVRYFGLDVRQYERVERIRPAGDGFDVETRTRAGVTSTRSARAVVLATGGFHQPNFLGIPGEDLWKVSHYYSEAHPYWNQDVVVVGGGNSAVEAALELFRVGARTTLVHFEDDFDAGVKPWLLPDIRNRIANGEIDARWRHRLMAIEPESVLLRDEIRNAEVGLPNDWVLALTGWQPDPVLVRSLGISIDEQSGVPEHDPGTMETPVPGVFIAGVLSAGLDANRIFIENGRWHGEKIVQRVAAK